MLWLTFHFCCHSFSMVGYYMRAIYTDCSWGFTKIFKKKHDFEKTYIEFSWGLLSHKSYAHFVTQTESDEFIIFWTKIPIYLSYSFCWTRYPIFKIHSCRTHVARQANTFILYPFKKQCICYTPPTIIPSSPSLRHLIATFNSPPPSLGKGV